MRFIDTEGLNSLSDRNTGPWRLDDDTILRTSEDHGRKPLATQEDAQAVYDVYRAVREAGIATPRPLEIVRTPEGYGVVVEYVHGAGVGLHLMLGLLTNDELGQKLGRLQRTLHAAHTSVGKDWNAEFGAWAHELSTLLPAELGDRLVKLVASIPQQNNLLHGDLHPGNVIIRKGELIPIDMEYAGYGNPLYDLAITCSRMRYNVPRVAVHRGYKVSIESLTKMVATIWDAHLRSYFADVSPEELDRISLVIDVLAEVENYCFRFYHKHVAVDEMEGRQQRCFAKVSQRLAVLLPQVTSVEL